MSGLLSLRCFVRISSAIIALLVSGYAEAAAQSAWTTDDSARVLYYAQRHDAFNHAWPRPEFLHERRLDFIPYSVTTSGSEIVVSPDGAHFFVVTRQGIPEDDTNRYELTVYSIQQISAALMGRSNQAVPPVVRTTFISRLSSGSPISDIRWQPDSQGILFRWELDNRLKQLCELSLRTGTTRQLTPESQTLSRAFGRGQGWVMLEESRRLTARANYPIMSPTRLEDGYAVIDPPVDFHHVTTVGFANSAPRRLDRHLESVWLSSNGRQGIATVQAPNGSPTDFVELNTDRGQLHDLPLVAGSHRSAVASALAEVVRASVIWSHDDRTAFIVNALPIEAAQTTADLLLSSSESRLRSVVGDERGIYAWEARTRSLQRIAPVAMREESGDIYYLIDVRQADAPGLSLIYQSLSGNRLHYRYLHTERSTPIVELAPNPPRTNQTISISVEQSMNSPPALVASSAAHRLILVPSDERLAARVTQTQTISWRDPSGETVTGLFVPPAGSTLQSEIPLIVQIVTHADPRIFNPDGPVSAGYATQLFSSHGFAVLSVPAIRGGANEARLISERVASALTALRARSMPNVGRIGIVGHSRTGFQALMVTLHGRCVPLSAAAILDSFTGSYASYLGQGADGARLEEQFDRIRGGSFWDRREEWMRDEVTFNVNRLRTPILFAHHMELEGRYSMQSGALQLLGAFNLTGRPSRSVWLPAASHTLERPRERAAEVSEVFNWFNFWLRGIEPASEPSQERWSVLRAQQERAEAEVPEPANADNCSAVAIN